MNYITNTMIYVLKHIALSKDILVFLQSNMQFALSSCFHHKIEVTRFFGIIILMLKVAIQSSYWLLMYTMNRL